MFCVTTSKDPGQALYLNPLIQLGVWQRSLLILQNWAAQAWKSIYYSTIPYSSIHYTIAVPYYVWSFGPKVRFKLCMWLAWNQTLRLQMAQNSSYLYTLGPKVSNVFILLVFYYGSFLVTAASKEYILGAKGNMENAFVAKGLRLRRTHPDCGR